MKVLLLVGGVLFLILGFVLCVAAVIVFFIARRRVARTAVAPPEARDTRAPLPQPPAAAPPVPAPPPVSMPDADGTIVVDTRRQFGALQGTSGALAGRIFPIEASGFYIGRDRTLSQVVIDNPSVSKRHVWIGVRDGAVIAIDQKSTNGTYLNTVGTRIGEVRLNPGDTLIISDDVARLSYQR